MKNLYILTYKYFSIENREYMRSQIVEKGIGQKVVELSDLGSFEKAIHTLNLSPTQKLDLDIFGRDKLTPLMNAGIAGNEAAFNAFLNRGADVDMKDALGNTAIMYAMEFGRHLIVKTALQKGANANIQNKKGITLLMIAARNDDIDGLALVIIYGNPNPFIKNEANMTAIDIAKINDSKEMIKILKGYEEEYTNKLITLKQIQLQ